MSNWCLAWSALYFLLSWVRPSVGCPAVAEAAVWGCWMKLYRELTAVYFGYVTGGGKTT